MGFPLSRGTRFGTSSGVNLQQFTIKRHEDGVAGDIVLAFVTMNNVPSFPAGWTHIGTGGPGATEGNLYAYRRILAAGEGTEFLISTGAFTGYIPWATLTITRQDPTTPVNVSLVSDEPSDVATVTADGVTTTAANCLLVAAMIAKAILTAPAGMTQLAAVHEGYGDAALYTYSVEQAAAAASGDKVAARDNSGRGSAILIAIAPDTTPRTFTAIPVASRRGVFIPTFSTPYEPDAWDTLIDVDGGDVRYLVEAEPYDPDQPGQVDRFWADKRLTLEPTDTYPHREYVGRAKVAHSVSRSILGGGVIGGGASVSLGEVVLIHMEADLEDLQRLAWDGWPLTVKLGGTPANGSPMAYPTYRTVNTARMTGLTVNDDVVEIAIEDRGVLFDADLQMETFAGTGGLEGGDDLKGKVKPLLIGKGWDVPALLVDPQIPRYMVSYAGLSAITRVCDSGVPLGAGQWVPNLAAGTFDLLENPAGTITCDAEWNGTGNTAAEVVRWIASTESDGPLTFPNDFAQDHYLAYKAAQPATIGLYYADRVTRRKAIADALAPAGWWYFPGDGKLRMGRIATPATPKATFAGYEVKRIKRHPMPRPSWRVELGCARCWTVLTGSEVGGAVRATSREQFLAQEFRSALRDDPSVLTVFPRAEPMPMIETPFTELVDGDTEAARLLPIYSTPWEAFDVTLPLRAFRVDIGDTIRLTYDGYGLEAGENFVVLGTAQNAVGATLTIWRLRDINTYVLEIEDDSGYALEFGDGLTMLRM